MTADSSLHPARAPIHVAVAVIRDGSRVLLSRRPDHVHQGGLWEFPGGKVEPGESVRDALVRELTEEIGAAPRALRPLLRIAHRYPEKSVLLDVWEVPALTAEPRGLEGQPVRWVPVTELARYRFPAANTPIVRAAALPSTYVITPDLAVSRQQEAWWRGLEGALARGHRLFQFRVPSARPPTAARIAARAVARIQAAGGQCLINADAGMASRVGADGVHLPARLVERTPSLIAAGVGLVGASCHSPEELARARAAGAHFAVLGPVKPTPSHPGAEPLGWVRFVEWVRDEPWPVYALGGLAPSDLPVAEAARAQGVAGIRGFWGAAESSTS